MVVVVPALLRSSWVSPCLLALNSSSPQSKKALFRGGGVRVDSLGGQDSAVLSTDSVGVNGFLSVVDKKKEEDRRRIGSLTDLGFVKKQKVSSGDDDDELEVLWDDGYGKNTVKDYLNISKEMIKPDGGPPRWFYPVECGRPLQGSPSLLFLPGMDGIGMGLVLHHKALGRAFQVRCLHIPVYDRTPFEGLVKFVEEAVRTEYALSPKKPIYLVGDSLGGGLALSVAARNPSIDLVLVLANPATSFDRSPLQAILPLLEALPDGLHSTIPYLLSLIMVDPVKMASVNIENRLSPPAVLEQLSANLTALLPLLSDNLARETLKGLLAPWLSNKRQRFGSHASSNGEVPSGKDISARSLTLSRIEADGNTENDSYVYPPFEFSTAFPPTIITEGSQGGPWRKKITELDGTEDEKDFPWWSLDCVLNNRLPPREHTKCSFYLHACEGSSVHILTQGKLSAPRILRIQKVVNYVLEKMVDKTLDTLNTDATFSPGGSLASLGEGSFKAGLKPWQKPKQSIEILCNNQVLSPEMSLATVQAYIWKKPEDLVLNYRVVQGR